MAENKLYDIYSVVYVPWWQTTWFHLALVGLALLCCGALLYVLIKQWKKKRAYKPSWLRAQEELERLSRSHDVDRGKEFYVQLLMILKQYLQERFGFDLLSKTDQEMVVHLQSIAFSREIIDMLRTIIDDGLMVKFAQYQVIREKMNKDLQLGITIVQRTTPRPI